MTGKRILIDTNKLIRQHATGGLRILIIAGFGNIILSFSEKIINNINKLTTIIIVIFKSD